MSIAITVNLSDETGRKLGKLAAQIGQPVDEFANLLIERGLSDKTFAEILAPVHEHSRKAGYTEEELDDFFAGLRHSARTIPDPQSAIPNPQSARTTQM